MTTNQEKICSQCGRNKTYVRTVKYNTTRGELRYCKSEHWLHDGLGGWMCHNCRAKLIDNPKESKESHHERNARRIKFKDKIIVLDEAPRIGVCNVCRAVVPFDCKATHMNHHEYYESDPRKGALETCPACHKRYHIAMAV